MDMIRTYLDMGGYGAFVWPAFVLSAVVLAGVLIRGLRMLKNSESALAEIGATNVVEEETRA